MTDVKGITELVQALECLEDETLSSYSSRWQNYQVVQTALENGIDAEDIIYKRILTVCSHDLKEDVRHTTVVLSVLMRVLNNVKENSLTGLTDELVTVAVAILHILKSSAVLKKVSALPILCCETLQSMPNDVCCNLMLSHSPILTQFFLAYFNDNVPLKLKVLPYKILSKLINSATKEITQRFVTENLTVLFTHFIPTIISASYQNKEMYEMLETIEELTVILREIDYTEHHAWQSILTNVTSDKYPAIMTSHLLDAKDVWYRLWNVLVRLLKKQITYNKIKNCSPINSMLPVVELAFKMDVECRCRAFQCWKVLTENIITGDNDAYITKGIKLLLIPLKSNNAKTKETAEAKFESWWNLIRRLPKKTDQVIETIYIPFLHFCYGKPKITDPNVLVPGFLSNKLKRDCIQALVESVGHVGCDSCVAEEFPKLKSRILNSDKLMAHLPEWVRVIKIVIRICGSEDIKCTETLKQMRCIWRSFLLNAVKIEGENRNIVFNEMVGILLQFVQDDTTEKNILEIIYNILIPSFFEESQISSYVFKEKQNDTYLLYRLLSLIFNERSQVIYSSDDPELAASKLKSLTSSFMISDNANETVQWILQALPSTDNAIIFWTSMIDTVKNDSNKLNTDVLKSLLLWPLNKTTCFSNMIYPALLWNTTYEAVSSKIGKTGLTTLLINDGLKAPTCNYFTVFALVQIINNILPTSNSNNADYVIELQLLGLELSKIDDSKMFQPVCPAVVNCIESVFRKLLTTKKKILYESILKLVNVVLQHLLELCQNSKTVDKNDILLMQKLLKGLNQIFKNEISIESKTIVVEKLVNCGKVLQSQDNIRNHVLSVLRTMQQTKETDSSFCKLINPTVTMLQNYTNNMITKEDAFTTPPPKAKKSKKKEPSIVNTVVENGEEFVVVKSNWKFNPKKLTEKQKDKLRKKREDIPALYQDLSQSQDEIKLVSWKTDSQDASSGSSKSTSKVTDNVSVMLNKMPSADIVPNIMKNIMQDNKVDTQLKSGNENKEFISPKSVKASPKPKGTKSPRMALKDRIFQNVKMLNEKSGNITCNGEVNNANQSLSIVSKTPPSKIDDKDIQVNSAPPNISADRPLRVKRKPRKFEIDYEEVPLKKTRKHSQENYSEELVHISPENACHISKQASISPITSSNNSESERVSEIGKENECIIKAAKVNDSAKKSHENKNNVNTKVLLTPTTDSQEKAKAKSDKKYKSRIESELAIDIVEGHPFLQTSKTSEKRSTRKAAVTNSNKKDKNLKNENVAKVVDDEIVNSESPLKQDTIEKKLRRKVILTNENGKKKKSDQQDNLSQSSSKIKSSKKQNSPDNIKQKPEVVKTLFNNKETDEIGSILSVYLPFSEDCIEDNLKSKDSGTEKVELVKFISNEKNTDETQSSSSEELPFSEDFIESSQDSSITTISVKCFGKPQEKLKIAKIVLEDITLNSKKNDSQSLLANDDSKFDIELSRNKTAPEDNHTPELDTEPLTETPSAASVIEIIDDDVEILSSANTLGDNDLPNTANADTQPMTPDRFATKEASPKVVNECNHHPQMQTETQDKDDSLQETNKESGLSSPFKGDDQRNKDFLNDTFEISPIKTMSPIKTNKNESSPKEDYIVIQLSSPDKLDVQPFHNSDSPEIFTDDKISPDKRDQSPPREENSSSNNNSPSLSLKKNRPQVRHTGRAAQMLGLCIPPNKISQNFNNEKSVEVEEVKKSATPVTTVRRNLRILYNCAESDSVDDNDDAEFLKLKRTLPSADSSPSGPILKRKLVDIIDEATASPASKRKRVSFHDPPVSTTVSVHKYIEPLGVRSPQSAKKLPKVQTNMKSSKRLENLFKLDSALTKTVEIFNDVGNTVSGDDIEMSSLEPTPLVEIVKTSELNNTEPICPELVDCIDPIDIIAVELSSPAMSNLLVKEWNGSIEKIGDLAKMNELEINRLQIKAPKIETVKKVLYDYLKKQDNEFVNITEVLKEAENVGKQVVEDVVVNVVKDVDVQTEIEMKDVNIETDHLEQSSVEVQAIAETSSSIVQTNESSFRNTEEVIKTCLEEHPDFTQVLSKQLQDSSKIAIAGTLPLKSLTDILASKLTTASSASKVLKCILKTQESDDSNSLTFIQNYLCQHFDVKRLTLFTSDILRKMYDKDT